MLPFSGQVSGDGVFMKLFSVELWALWFGFGLMVLAAVINARTLMVPNWLSLSAAVAGWLTALLVSCSVGVPSQGGGLLASLAATGVGFLLLLPFHAAGFLGAGCVKMQAAFGAWVGCALPPIPAALLVGLGTLVGGAFTAAGSAAKTRTADSRRARDLGSRLFPAQITLSLGSICGAAVPLAAGWV